MQRKHMSQVMFKFANEHEEDKEGPENDEYGKVIVENQDNLPVEENTLEETNQEK